MYGFTQKYLAETKRDVLAFRQPEYRFEVMPHSWSPQGVPLTWGVGCYMPYCEAMPERFAGFVWFNPSR